jgi:hypothetical protein
VATVTRTDDEWTATLHADGTREVPFGGFLRALEEAAERLGVER